MGFSSITLEPAYRTAEVDPAQYFFPVVLQEAITYDRAVGFFRSTFLSVIGESVIDFARRGGKIRLICSPRLSEEDIAAMERGHQLREEVVEGALSRDLDEALSDTSLRQCAEILATLVAFHVLDIRIATREPKQGLYHEKLGILADTEGHLISFTGSSNETYAGLHPDGNFESIEVFSSLWGERDVIRTKRHLAYFKKLWANEAAGVKVTTFPVALRDRLLSVARPSLNEFEVKEMPAARYAKKRVLLPHQQKALQNWESSGRRGIFKHATGSGKTVTALAAIARHVADGKPALVVVPSQLLLGQWSKEISAELPDAKLLVAGAGNNIWRHSADTLRAFTSNDTTYGPRIVLAIMHTAVSDGFFTKLCPGSHVLFVADEVHQLGSPEFSKLLAYDAGSRLGLSATPERYGDLVGTQKIFNYFGEIIPPIVSLKDALRAGRLVPYRYFPHTVVLTPDEETQWSGISKQIGQETAIASSNKNAGRSVNDARLKLLLIQRARLAKKAAGKGDLALKIISKFYKSGDSWLVYCDDSEQLSALKAILQAAGFAPLEYYSDMQDDANATLQHFSEFGGLLLSIRCLDEGVDIPSITHALILASSQNPRQFIQRRGRVLRTYPTKLEAVIYDVLVRPVDSESNKNQMNYFRAELSRAIEFAGSAINAASVTELMKMAAELGIDPEEILVEDIEDENT